MHRTRHAARALVLIALAATALTSCISAQQRDYVKYDPAKDQFDFLMVLSDIRASESDDLGYLEALYRNRDHWIAPAIPGGANVWPLFAFSLIRTDNTHIAPLNIFASRPNSLDTLATQVPLADIKITPGTFFVEGGKLGYYQAASVPGKVIDAALAELTKAGVTDDMSKGIQEELDRRASGGKTHTWAELKEQTLKNITMDMPQPGADAPPEQINPLNVLSPESLKNLQQAITGKSLALTRSKSVLSISLPLTAEDAGAAVDLWNAVLARSEQAAKDARETPENRERIAQAKSLAAAGKLLKVDAGATGLKASLDLITFTQSINSSNVARIDLNTKDNGAPNQPAAPDVLAYLKEKNITPEAGLTAAGIVKDFQAGTLKGHPSDTPVKPGEGIVAKPQ
jgi:hypothetical protein